MLKSKILIRYIIFIIGLFSTGIGIALSTKMGLGTTPISVIPLVLSTKFPLTFGVIANILSLVFVLIEILIQRKGLNKDIIMQLFVIPFFGYFIDIGFMIFENLSPVAFETKIALLITGCAAMAFGIYLQISANVAVNPCDGLVKIISEKTKIKFSKVKILVDVSIMMVGIIISVIIFGEIIGVGIATVLLAILTGSFIKVFKMIFAKINLRWLVKN